MSVRILTGHVLDKLAELPDESCQMCVTSPPYYGLRAYNTEPQVWGGDEGCEHEWGDKIDRAHWIPQRDSPGGFHRSTSRGAQPNNADRAYAKESGAFCLRCHAWHGELGQEPTVDLYVSHLVAVFAAVKRVLRKDGVLFVNLGDSYAGSWSGNSMRPNGGKQRPGKPGFQELDERYPARGGYVPEGAKPKDLMLVPDRFRLAMQADGWYVRSKMPWVKRNCMPESCKDRPVSAVEDVMLFTRSPRYFWDAEAVKRDHAPGTAERYKAGYNLFGVGQFTGSPTEKRGPKPIPPEKLDHLSGRNFRTSDLFFDSLGLILDEPEPHPLPPLPEPEDEDEDQFFGAFRAAMTGPLPEPKPRKSDASAGPLFAPLGLILDESGAEPDVSYPRTYTPIPPMTEKGRVRVEGIGLPKKNRPNSKESGGMGTERVNAGPPFPPQGLILDEAGDPLALDVNPAPFKDAHFATFPPKLVRPLILAGTSERGACANCGAPWVRVVEKSSVKPIDYEGKYLSTDPQSAGRRMLANVRARRADGNPHDNPFPPTKTTGWSPSCSCDAAVVPCTVLDIFAGSGTTGLVADQLGRDAVLIDLQPSYVAMGADRITGDAPLFANVEVNR